MLQPRVNEEVTYVSNCLGLSCIICAASLFRGSSGLGSCTHTALQLGMFGQPVSIVSSQVCLNCIWLWPAAAGTSRCRQPILR